MARVLALFGNLSYGELLFILVVAIMVFGRRLPEVAARGAHQVVKLRRSLGTMWRETGLAEEWRQLQRGVDSARRFDPLQGGPETWRRRLDQQGLPEAQNAPEGSDWEARHAPEVPWDSREPHRPAAASDAEAHVEEPDSTAAPAEPGVEPATEIAPEIDPDSGAPPGSVPRS